MPPLNLPDIQALLTTSQLGRPRTWQNEFWDSIDSTNNRLLELAKLSAPHGLMVIARQQTAGRGRLGRTWVSPIDAGIYLSFLLRLEKSDLTLPILTLAAGFAVAQAIQAVTTLVVGIKWVNDIVYAERKIGGILAELANTSSPSPNNGGPQSIVLGIGLNLSRATDDIPVDLVDKIGWLEDFTEEPIDSNRLVSQIAAELENVLHKIKNNQLQEILDGWRNLSVTLGKEVLVISGNQSFGGLAVDITPHGALIVETKTGKKELHAGEISVRLANGKYL